MKKTVVELDLVGYSTVCDNFEQGLDVNSAVQLNQQIQSFVDIGLNAVNTGCGEELVAPLWSAVTCHRFGHRRPVAAVFPTRPRVSVKQSFHTTAATGRRRPKRRQVGALQNKPLRKSSLTMIFAALKIFAIKTLNT